jgi:hypothetical protein
LVSSTRQSDEESATIRQIHARSDDVRICRQLRFDANTHTIDGHKRALLRDLIARLMRQRAIGREHAAQHAPMPFDTITPFYAPFLDAALFTPYFYSLILFYYAIYLFLQRYYLRDFSLILFFI